MKATSNRSGPNTSANPPQGVDSQEPAAGAVEAAASRDSFAAGADRMKALLHTLSEVSEAQLTDSNGEDDRDYGVLTDMIEDGLFDAYSQEPNARWGFSLALADLFAHIVDGATVTHELWDPMAKVARSCAPPRSVEGRLSMIVEAAPGAVATKRGCLVNVGYSFATDTSLEDLFNEVDCVLDTAIGILDTQASDADLPAECFGALYMLRHVQAAMHHRHRVTGSRTEGARHG